ncbi:sacsin isoform X2 [Telopea speciosissima]|uniref:sacsin isoform X2 n=1 Tax=Telopea speciosissima TaxID=54955 RepID=UPI001CC72657|nr:sacsin isoform X2 [Telopea speciosissima]
MASHGADSLLLEDFGQKVDLTRRIREVLANYPEGTTVLKELIQNADDAGATKVCLCLDQRVHGVDSLLSDKLAEWQGPALLAFNDAEFTEDDFISISRIGGSKKQGQAWKTGRFGVGFNSVYHLTDLPSFVSGKYVVLFDPQGVYLPNISVANPGKRIEYVSSSAISIYNDQFFPYCAFGCDMKQPFHGTLFRFPLRNTDQGAISKLSRQAYSEDHIYSMFAQLYKEGIFTLLFLKSVLSVEMYIWDAGAPEPRKLYSCCVSSANDDITWHRQTLLRLSNSVMSVNNEVDSFSLDFLSEAILGTHLEKKMVTYFIVQAMASGSSKIGAFAAAAFKEYDINLLPWASVAACISDGSLEDDVLKHGQAFCFLPLPVRTGLPVQINGYFEVSSNRRSIWYGADMDRVGKLRSDWNRLLLEDVVVPAFTKLLLDLRGLLGPSKLYYSIWPRGSFEEPWSLLVDQIYRSIGKIPVLYSYLEGGKWVSPSEAFLHDKEFSKSKELGEALVLLGMPIVHLSSPLFDMLLKYSSSSKQRVVSPVTVRHFLTRCELLITSSRFYKLVLLEYCLQDLIDAEVGQYASSLPLLPLASGDFGSFSEASQGISYFVCGELEYMLLQQIPDRVIDRNIPLDILNRLTGIAMSSTANIVVFNVQYLLQLLPRFFPAQWRYKERVLWDPESTLNHPLSSWFMLFWQYLRDRCETLSIFCDWPILPTTSGYLYRASRSSKLINAEKLSDTLRELLAKIGCKILNPNYGVEHHELSQYVCDVNGASVLEAIFDVVSSNEGLLQLFHNIIDEDEKNELRQFLLDPNWYVRDCIADCHIRNCRRLPIFKVYSGASPQTFNFSDLENPRKYLPPFGVPDYFLGGEFIGSLSNNEEEILLRFYGIERMGKARFFKLKMLNRIGELQPEFRNKLMISIMQDLPHLCVEDISLREALRKLEFVPTLSGVLKRPEVLYDPRNEELYYLLEDSDSFPYGVFQDPGVLDMLLGLGLRTSVSPEVVIQSARQVELLMHKDQGKAHLRGKVLLSYLEVNASKWSFRPPSDGQRAMNKLFSQVATTFKPRNLEFDVEKFWNDLRMICWCPVLVDAPHPALPWPVVSSMVAPPKLVRLRADLWLGSASMRILDGECSSTALSFSLGWSSPPAGSVISAQLLELGKNNELVTDQVLRQELTLAMPRIYSILTSMVGSDEMDIVKAVLEGCRWIWVGDGFATSDEVVLNGPLHLAPYIRVIPVDLAVFRELFLELGIREILKPTDYANILSRMAVRKADAPLDPQELRAAVLVVQHLAEVQFQNQQVQIYLPDVSSRLFPAANLVYNDAPWLLGSGDPDTAFVDASTVAMNARRTVHKFVHGNISNDVADKLGVCSLRRILLAESADSMNLSLSGAAEAFGQHEALTTRLKHIVEMYADGPGILFELVQNAEDAGASEVVFLLDKTQYGTSSVLSPEMADWQGPALYCFNSSVFSQQDLYAISRIGQDSKLEKPFAIGRFGLGFNCVYHFTDIPAFVSGENLVMFDPHACNLPGISPSHPGLRIRFAGRRILEQFPDQFTPFLHFGCDLQQSFPGTLFRFPLRTESAASRSQIKKEKYAIEDVLSLFYSFSEVVSEALLFLRNVKTISLFVKDGVGHEMQLLHRVNRHCINEPKSDPNPLHPMLGFIHGNQRSVIDKDQFLNILKKTPDNELPWNCQKIMMTEHKPSGDISHLWVVSESLGGGRAKKKSLALENRSHNFIPWACVAAHLQSVNLMKTEEPSDFTEGQSIDDNPCNFHVPLDFMQDRRDFEGRAFCFLPLPITTGLPTHINAYFELSSNRRDIWFGSDMTGGGKARSDWNIYILEDVVAPAYGHLLEKLATEVGPCDLFFTLWPTKTGLEPWASLVRKLYISIADLGLRVLYTKVRGGQWIPTKQAIFPDFTFPRATELIEALSDAGLPTVIVSKPVVERFMEVCPLLHYLTPQLLRTLLIRRNRGFKNRDAMILTLEYCLSDIKGPVNYDCLHGLQLVPLANGLFTTFNRKSEGERIFVTSGDEYDLLKDSIPHLLVDSSVPGGVHRKLHDIAEHGHLNISLLTCHLLEGLFPRFLPADWQNAKQVSWEPGHEGQPNLEWMGKLWSYLKSSCDDLSIFSRWPILPVGKNCLLQLVRNSNVIKDDGWSENMASLLEKTGCFLLKSDVQIDHPQLNNFVQDPTASGILDALLGVAGEPQEIGKLFDVASEGELHELRSFILQSKWFCADQMDCRHIETIKNLPMFESYRSRKLVSLSKPTKWLKPEGVHEDLLNEEFIRTESEREKTILRSFLGLREPRRVEFYKDYVLNRMAEFLSQEGALLAILQDVKLLIEEDTSIKDVLSQTAFVLTADGSWKHPSRLYDPRIDGFKEVLHREAFFPSEKFLDGETLDILVSLGLRRTLGFTGLLDCALSVSMMHDSGDPEALNYGRGLLACLDALGSKLSNGLEGSNNEISSKIFQENSNMVTEGVEYMHLPKTYMKNCCNLDHNIFSCLGDICDKPEEDFWLEMKAIPWCPVYVSPPLQGLPWLLSKCQVACPSVVRPRSQMWMVSSMMHILDGECHSSYLQSKLGWVDSPNIGVLTTQLIELSKSYGQLKFDSVLKATLDSTLQKEIPTLYLKLQEFICTDGVMIAKSALSGVSWVWIGDDFISPKALAFDSPVKFHPYLYAVPSELSEFRDLLLALGVRPTFDSIDYFHALQRLQHVVKGSPLLPEQLSFVSCVLEAVADCYSDKPLSETSNTPLLVPDSSGILMSAMDLVYNDAPWMEKNAFSAKRFVHPSISNDLASRLGIQSLRCLSLVEEEMTKDLPCMDYSRISELLDLYGNNDFLLFDLLELADCCKAKKLHLILDKREHPRQSLLQHNLGEFQGPALLAILEGATLSRDEVSSLQLLPPWRLRGSILNYGLGLLSCYSICDLLSIVSSGYYYMFDPRGLALALPSNPVPSAKMFSLTGTDLTERFSDQFNPMLVGQNMPWSSLDTTIIRMPLQLECMKDGLDDGFSRIKQIFDRFLKHSSTTLLFLKSVLQVSLSTWEEGNKHPCQDYSFFIDPSSAVMRNPFSDKKWRKFQISRLFSSSSAAIKMHTIDVNIFHKGTKVVDKWLVVLCLGSGQSRNMALDRQYLAYNLTPVAGVAAHISRNGQPTSAFSSSCILSPLPLSGDLPIPVTAIGCFLVCHNRGRYLFKYQDMIASTEAQRDAGNQLIEAWNRELMSCVRDSYVEMVLEIQKLRRDPSNSSIESASVRSVSLILQAYSDRIYLFWPRSNQHSSNQHDDASNPSLLKMFKADWECIIKQVIRPFYARLVDLPVWQLYSGNLVKAEEGMFLAQPGNGVGDSVPPATVCGFIKEHYPVFSVPWELVTEIQAVGVAVGEIRPKMVRDLLRASSSSIVLRSVETYLDVLEYSLSDIQLQESSTSSNIDASLEHNTLDSVGGGSIQESSMVVSSSNLNMCEPPWLSTHSPVNSGADALEVVTNFGKALFDFGRGVVEDFGIAGVPMVQRNSVLDNSSGSGNADQKFLNIAAELKGLPCPTATRHLARLGITELWIANKEQQKLMLPLAAKFIHPKCLGRPILDEIFSSQTIQRLMKLQSFSPYLLASHMKLLFSEHWVNHVMNVNKAPWFSWESGTDSSGEGGPSPEWVRLFWKNLSGSSGDLSLFSDWPLIPAFLGRPVLCRVREHNMVFIPPVFLGSTTLNVATELSSEEPDMRDSSESQPVQSYVLAFEVVKSRHPSLLSLLNQCNIPAYDIAFLECAAPSHCLPMPGQSLGQVIASKLLAAKQAGYFSEPASFTDADRDYLFTLFASDFNSSSATPYKREELDVLRDLPIYKTVVGSYTKLYSQNQCIISADSFFQPLDEHCLYYTTDTGGNMLFRALDVPELHDQEILVRFALPGFENKAQSEQEDILIYLYVNWQDLQLDPTVIGVLKETKFVRNSDELCLELLKPQDLFDPGDSLLTLVFSGEKRKFPGERFGTDGWLHILRKTGLRTATEVDVIVECARKVESLGGECMKSIEDADEFEADFSSQNEIPFEIWSLAGAVLDSIFSNFAVFYSSNFCNTLSKIAFIPAEKGFPSIGGKKGGKRVLSSYNEAILLKDWPLGWSCAPILSRQNVVPPEYSWGAFHLRSPPVFSTVLKHLQVVGRNCGEDTLAHWPISPGMMTIEGASCEVLKYLDKIWGSLSASDILELRKVAFMPAANGTRLVTANSLFVRLTVNLSPFAFELPTIYLPFVKILKDLGLQDLLSVACAKDLLMNLQKACGYQRLNPNELRAVMEILHFVCNGSVQENKSDGSCSDVIIPDDGCRLVLASSCVYIDPYGSRYLRCIDTSRLRFVHPYLSEGICTALGIRKLSEVVVEELNHGQKLQFVDEIDSVPLSMVRQKLSSRSFQLAVWTVLNSINSYISASGDLALEQIESSLKHIADKLQFVRCLRTSFILLPKHLDITRATKQSILPEWEDGSGHGTLHFIDQSKNCILVAEPPDYISVLDVISIIVSQVLGSTTPLPIGPLFSCPEDLEKVVVSTLRLGSERGEIGTIGGSDRLLGKDLLPQDALQVQFHPLRPFYAGEMVAWRTGKNGEKLKYGRVPLDVRPSAGQALYRLKVETAPGISEPLVSSQVFSFRAISTVSEASPSTLPEGGHTETSSQMHVPMREIAGKGKSELSQLQGAKEFQYGRVSPAELVNAVHDMLSAAGIDMDVEKQSLLQTTLTLQEQLKESQAALLLEQEKADMAAKEADTAKAAWMCRVCLSAEVDVTIVPCGHVLCRRCSSAVSRCPFCRTQASRTMKIFRP